MPDKIQEGKIQNAVDVLRAAEGKSHLREPIDDISLKMANRELSHYGYPPLPEDYIALMHHAYGIMGPYLTLLPMGGMKTANGGHQPGMIETSEAFNRQREGDAQKTIVVGKMSGGVVITYDHGQYHVVDESSRDVFRSYADIADVITDTVVRLNKAPRSPAPHKL